MSPLNYTLIPGQKSALVTSCNCTKHLVKVGKFLVMCVWSYLPGRGRMQNSLVRNFPQPQVRREVSGVGREREEEEEEGELGERVEVRWL